MLAVNRLVAPLQPGLCPAVVVGELGQDRALQAGSGAEGGAVALQQSGRDYGVGASHQVPLRYLRQTGAVVQRLQRAG